MRALVLEKKHQLNLRDIDVPSFLSADDVRIQIHTVGICGSDVHYYTHGSIGNFVVNAPMVLGHEASGVVTEVGANVSGLAIGDRVCMEPGVPNFKSRATKLGIYNVDPAVRFWATPPVHGCLTASVVHPAAFTYKLADNVSFAEAAMVEPFAVGMHAAIKAQIKPGDIGVVLGAGTIGIMIAIAALAAGCAKVYITDVHQPKLDIASAYNGIIGINIQNNDAVAKLMADTEYWGADVVFEASGNPHAIASLTDFVRPGGNVVLVGLPTEKHSLNINSAIDKEISIQTVFRYANVFDRALNLIASGKVDLKPLISDTYSFEQSIEAFDRAVEGRPADVKLQIIMADK
ncbi:MAG: NAD(P)-dependent alcohol dehydrogenase [Rhizobiales bacterium]|nr:NAD(P)-dependent alcohol dehydrogenase [Hyphomicrobiales bacterium]NRB13262.1 NAD(P)-dependent alcohol dehydrogenase [Hyphomicrobiales bacterium]